MLPSNTPMIPDGGYDGPGVMQTNVFITGVIKIIILLQVAGGKKLLSIFCRDYLSTAPL